MSRDSEQLEQELERALQFARRERDTKHEKLQAIMQVLGPSPGCSDCCDGCRTEMQLALEILHAAGITYIQRKASRRGKP